MNLVYLSPHFPPNFMAFPIELRKRGGVVLGVGEAAFEHLPEHLQSALNWYVRVENMEDYGQVGRAVAHLVERFGPIDRVESHNEHWLRLEAWLRDQFRIPGKRLEEIDRLRSKSHMKDLFRRAGLRVAAGTLADSPDAVRAFVREVGFPVIAKPDTGVGAARMWRLDNDGDVDRFLADRDRTPYLLEEFIEGQLLSFDGLADAEGRAVFTNAMVFSRGILDVVREDDHLWYYTLRDIPDDLLAAGLAAVRAFDVREKFFHIEFFRRRKDHALVALEANLRPPGGLSTDLFNYANDFDIYRLWAGLVMTGRFEGEITRAYHAAYIGRKDPIAYIHTVDDILHHFGREIVAVQRIPPVFRDAIGDTAYIARTRTLADLRPIIRFIQDRAA